MKSYILLTLLAFIFLAAALGRVALANEAGHEHDHDGPFSLVFLVRPLGIATLSFVSGTFLTGLFRRKLGRRFLKLHLPLAIVSVILGFIHGILVLVLFG